MFAGNFQMRKGILYTIRSDISKRVMFLDVCVDIMNTQAHKLGTKHPHHLNLLATSPSTIQHASHSSHWSPIADFTHEFSTSEVGMFCLIMLYLHQKNDESHMILISQSILTFDEAKALFQGQVFHSAFKVTFLENGFGFGGWLIGVFWE